MRTYLVSHLLLGYQHHIIPLSIVMNDKDLSSCMTGEGVHEFECALSEAAMSIITGSIDKKTPISHKNALITRDRHRHHLKQCLSHLNEFLDGNLPMDIAAEELRLAMMELGKITGVSM